MRLIDAEQAYEIARLYHSDFAISLADLTSLKDVLLSCDTIEVPRWIPVTERLPTWADGNKYGGILAVRRGHELSDFYHCNDVKENPDEFSHWMPLPKLLKDGDT